MKLTKKILERLILEELEEQDSEEEPEEDYTEKYEDALSEIHDCEKRVDYLKKRLEKCQEKTNTSSGNWSDLWENN